MSSTSIPKKLKAIGLFADFSDDLLARLAENCTFTSLDEGTCLFNSGDNAEFCYIVCYGAVRLSRQLRGGKEVVMSFCRTGDFVGAFIMINPNPRYPVTGTITEMTGLITIPRQRFLDTWQAEPVVAKTVNMHMMNRLMEFQEDKARAVSSVPQRIASFILRTLDTQPADFGHRLNIKLARRDIAERVGTTVETVIRILSQWTQNGWIATEDQRIDVLNRAALQEIVDKE